MGGGGKEGCACVCMHACGKLSDEHCLSPSLSLSPSLPDFSSSPPSFPRPSHLLPPPLLLSALPHARFIHHRIPLIVFIAGIPGIGKSTIATHLAQRLNLPNVLQVNERTMKWDGSYLFMQCSLALTEDFLAPPISLCFVWCTSDIHALCPTRHRILKTRGSEARRVD